MNYGLLLGIISVSLSFFQIVYGDYVTSFGYKITDNAFECTPENAFNIRWAIAKELNISVDSVEVTCGNLQSR